MERKGIQKRETSGVIKNNDHFAISWQITIHQIVQITDISQWREFSPSLPLSVFPSALPFLWWVGSAAVRMATAIRLHQFYGNKLLWPLPLLALLLSLNRYLSGPVAAAGEWVELSWTELSLNPSWNDQIAGCILDFRTCIIGELSTTHA